MKITRDELERLKVTTNNVLVKPDILGNDTLITKGGLKLFLDNTFNPELHIAVTGTIIKNPPKLFFKHNDENSMGWKTTIETNEGDKVMYTYISAAQALGKLYNRMEEHEVPKYFFCDDELYIFLKYEDLILIREGDEVKKMLNGLILVSPVEEEEVKSQLLKLPDWIRKKKSNRYGIVECVGSRIEEYYGYENSADVYDLEKGDYVVIDPCWNIQIEYELHQQLPKNYYKIHRKNISAVILK